MVDSLRPDFGKLAPAASGAAAKERDRCVRSQHRECQRDREARETAENDERQRQRETAAQHNADHRRPGPRTVQRSDKLVEPPGHARPAANARARSAVR